MVLADFLPQFYQGRVCKYATRRRMRRMFLEIGFRTWNPPTLSPRPYLGRGGLVVRSRIWGRRVPGSRPDSTEDPSCMGPVAR
ncbi:hypothetical protein AVEN_116546-1 [Araneus ventricosus]|uniref:Uncharacterized protein n=1 Tax=Araneus ventricosus TaxID=182803 RepID=A0A4Y2KPU1_ARAVE|nr:hypothetical protein AVEN_116546-1 [Araneus ventricosus]